jgi:exodeoxyribonuclease-1
VPWAHLRSDDFQRLGLDPDAMQERAARLRAHGPALAEKARQVFAGSREHADGDVDGSLYAGFCGDGDRRLCTQVRATSPAELATRAFDFRDPRLPELLFRYRARNWPQTLSPDERERWDGYRRHRLVDASGLSEYDFAAFFAEIAALRASHAGDGGKLILLDQLELWGHELRSGL